jgi:hypothetical protein
MPYTWQRSVHAAALAAVPASFKLGLSDGLAELSWPLALQYKTFKVVYRRYAGLFFSICIDITDNELTTLEAVHLFVEILDHYFQNVCELDLVFNFHKVCVPN